jgi:agmatine deiminase
MRVTEPPPLPTPTPSMLGYRMPAEWEPHQATWLTWPHCEATWPGKLASVIPAYVAMIDALRGGEVVHVNTLGEAHREEVKDLLAKAGIATGPGTPVHLHLIPTDDEWVRDYGALFVVREPAGASAADTLAATDWVFNAWGEKYDRVETNNTVPQAMADLVNVRRFELPIVMEGGSIDVNGRGVALTTESCLLNPNRNPGLTKTDVAQWLHAGLNVRHLLWLGDGIAGDDTDGHVDDMTRFVAPDTVVTAVEDDPADANHAPLRDNLERLRAARLPDGSALRIVELPMPEPLYHQGERLPASHANFYIGNRAVLLPVFGGASDARAAAVMQGLFPDREIVGVPSTDLVWGLGACHCLSQQVPAKPGPR